ncbi:MAG: protein-L-isoaspartate O-methyltransferase [Bdellovibrionota bacterium]
MLPKPSIEQERLLETIRNKAWVKISKDVESAYLETPRHQFVKKFSVDYDHWIEVDDDTIKNYLPLIYADATLLIWDDNHHVSTISQPSLVLHMLELLDLKPSMRVFELGTGSGWNAAMLGRLVGKSGEVVSYEIIPELARDAEKVLSHLDLPQVKIKSGDAAEMIKTEAPFDRGVFTAGAFDLPLSFFDKVKEGGKLLFVLKTGGDDLLLSLEKRTDHFVEVARMRCRFVSVMGEMAPKGESPVGEIPENVMIYPKGQEQGRKIFIHGETCSYVV